MFYSIQNMRHSIPINIFRSRCRIQGKTCSFIIDYHSRVNLVSSFIVDALNLPCQEHSKPYHLQGFNHGADMKITKCCLVSFNVGGYCDDVWCDVIPMEVTHLLLGRPWQIDRNAVHRIMTNRYSIMHKGQKFTLGSLAPEEAYDEMEIVQKFCERIKQRQLELQREESIDHTNEDTQEPEEVIDRDYIIKEDNVSNTSCAIVSPLVPFASPPPTKSSVVLLFQDFAKPLREAQLNHSTYEKIFFSIGVADRSLQTGSDSWTNLFEHWGNDMRMRGVKLVILDKKLKLLFKVGPSAKLQRQFEWDPGIFGLTDFSQSFQEHVGHKSHIASPSSPYA